MTSQPCGPACCRQVRFPLLASVWEVNPKPRRNAGLFVYILIVFTVYALSSIPRKYVYVGMTSNLENRILRHISGYEKKTRPYRPFKLIYQKNFPTRSEAWEFEKYLKTTKGKKEILGV